MKVERDQSPQKSTDSNHDGYCCYRYSVMRCPFPGNLLDGNRWWCLHHHNPANRANDLEQREFFQVFNPETENGRQCILEKIEDWYPDTLTPRRDAIIEAHPEWQRGPREGRTE